MTQQCDTHSKWGNLRRFLPIAILLVITALAGGTDVFSSKVHEVVSKSLAKVLENGPSYVVNGLIVLCVFAVAYAFYHPVVCGVQKLLAKATTMRPQLQDLIARGTKLVYWGMTCFIAVTFFAPEIMAKLAVGTTFAVGALAIAFQGLITSIANDFIAGIYLQGTGCLKNGDSVKSSSAEGKLVEIGELRTVIDSPDGRITVPNSKLWNDVLTCKKPPEPKLLMPGTKRWMDANSK